MFQFWLGQANPAIRHWAQKGESRRLQVSVQEGHVVLSRPRGGAARSQPFVAVQLDPPHRVQLELGD